MTTRLTEREQWETILPEMGYMALLRNLRNFDDAGVKDSLATKIGQKLANPDEVRKSKQLPFRFLSAYQNAPSVRWHWPLEQALNACIPNIPELPGRSLVLIDTSGSMQAFLSQRKERKVPRGERAPVRPTLAQAAALFGLAVALRNPGRTDVWGFADGQMLVDRIGPGDSLLKLLDDFIRTIGAVGYGTEIHAAVRDTYKNHDRVFIFTDMQTFPTDSSSYAYYGDSMYHRDFRDNDDISAVVPKDKHVYGFNLAGYGNSALATGSFRHEMGGLTDHTFKLIPLLEAGQDGKWPWE